MNSLFSFAKSDQIKYLVYKDFGMNEILRIFIYNGNEDEQEISFKLLYQLSFDERVAKDILNDNKMFDIINNNVSKSKNCNGISWVIKNKFNQEPFPSRNKTSDTDISIQDNNKHIMISYNKESRDYCLGIKGELEKIGKRCWIDVDNICGSSLESMAEAIEQSECILVCMTELYKLSPNCRLEAEYIIQRKKPFVPLIMQKEYKPDGWFVNFYIPNFVISFNFNILFYAYIRLGLILGQKIFIDTNKYSFDECFQKVVKEINSITKNTVKNAVFNTSANSTKQTKTIEMPKALEWTSKEIYNWLNEKKLNLFFMEKLNNFNGEILNHLLNFYKKSPEFFYEKILSEANGKIDLFDLIQFTFELEKLFN